MLFLSGLPFFLGTPKLQMELHPLILSKTPLNNHWSHFFSKQEVTGQSLLCLHLVVEVHASSSAVILQPLRNIYDPIVYLTWQYRGAEKSLARPGRKQATATEDFEFHISYL
jgi:hypothetical protein